VLRLIFFFLIAYIIVSAIKASRKKTSIRRNGSPIEGQEMVLDPQCQSYISKSEAIRQGENYFCSPECAKLFLTR
jgi:hypothetical protein